MKDENHKDKQTKKGYWEIVWLKIIEGILITKNNLN